MVDSDALTFPIRAGTEADHAYVVSSWVLSNRQSAIARDIGAGYCRRYRPIIRACLKDARLTVACSAEDSDTIIGWAVTGPRVVHYVYVRHGCNRLGVARSLLKPYIGHETTYTHRPADRSLVPNGWTYVPFVVYLLESHPAEMGAIEVTA
jgi:hypothetical protein